jgi:ATP-dependent Clp protease ATP-binding subunit ClpC
MFERFTERARRVLFFARYEASQLGGESIESEHLLLGLMRERRGLINEIFDRAHVRVERIWEEIARRSAGRPKVPTSVEMPFGDDVKRVLVMAAQEADQLNDKDIGREHLLLGLLRAEGTVAASILASNGLRFDAVRQEIVTLRAEGSSDVGRST